MWNASRFGHRGAVLIYVAIFLAALIALVGLAMDTAYVYLSANQLQNAADSAALAGALHVRSNATLAHNTACDTALLNKSAGDIVQLVANAGNAADGDVVIGVYNPNTRNFTPTLTRPNAVRVVARRRPDAPGGPVSLFFSPSYGVSDANVVRRAIAMSGGGSSTGVIALDWHAKNALDIRGTASLLVPDRAIQVNSDHSKAVNANGTVTIEASQLSVTGDGKLGNNIALDGEYLTDMPRKPDPLAHLPVPPWNAGDDLGGVRITTDQTIDLSPGYYSTGIYANSGTIRLAPGIYVLDGEGISIGGNANLHGEGVMLYVKGKGEVDIGGGGDVYLTPPDRFLHNYPAAATYEGVTIFQERTNDNEARIIGNSEMDINGAVYVAGANLEVGGTGGGIGNNLVANTFEVSGTANITIERDNRYPFPGGGSYLVE